MKNHILFEQKIYLVKEKRMMFNKSASGMPNAGQSNMNQRFNSI